MVTQELPEGAVTVLFTDVDGSTELTNRLGDDDSREVLGACDELVRRQVAPHRAPGGEGDRPRAEARLQIRASGRRPGGAGVNGASESPGQLGSQQHLRQFI